MKGEEPYHGSVLLYHMLATRDKELALYAGAGHTLFWSPEGALGAKTRRGVYQKVGPDIQVLDLATGSYRLSEGAADEKITEILKNRNAAERFEALHASDHPQARFLWSIYRDVWHYCALWAISARCTAQ